MLEFKDPIYPSGLSEEVNANTTGNDEPYDKHHGFVVSFYKFEKKLLIDLINAELSRYKAGPKDETFFTLEKILKKLGKL